MRLTKTKKPMSAAIYCRYLGAEEHELEAVLVRRSRKGRSCYCGAQEGDVGLHGLHGEVA